MQVWDYNWLVTLSRSHCRSSMGFGEHVQQKIKSMRIIDFNKEKAQDHEVDKKTFSKDRLCTCTRQARTCHAWLRTDTPDVSFLSVTFNGNGVNQTGTLTLFRRGNTWTSEVWCPLTCSVHTGRDYKSTFIKAHLCFSLAQALSIPSAMLTSLPARLGSSIMSFL